MDYYVTFSGRNVIIHNGRNGARQNIYSVNHDICDVQVCGEEFYVIGPDRTTTFCRQSRTGFTFYRTGVHCN